MECGNNRKCLIGGFGSGSHRQSKGVVHECPQGQSDEIASWDDTTFLNKAKITIRGKITNTAIVLLGREESEHLISPAVAKIKWILRGPDNVERDYMIASCPFILAVDKIYDKIRNLKYRYINPEYKTLFPKRSTRMNRMSSARH